VDAASAAPRGPVLTSSLAEEAASLSRLRSRVIGAGTAIPGPFGERPLRYFDYIARLLNDHFGIQVRAGCMCAGPYGHLLLHINEARSIAIRHRLDEGHLGEKPGWVRISFSPTVSEDEFQALLEGVDAVARRGRELAEGYELDDETGEWARRTPAHALANGKETR
jgi:hypothetical protein